MTYNKPLLTAHAIESSSACCSPSLAQGIYNPLTGEELATLVVNTCTFEI